MVVMAVVGPFPRHWFLHMLICEHVLLIMMRRSPILCHILFSLLILSRNIHSRLPTGLGGGGTCL